jgi:hypothetical protein
MNVTGRTGFDTVFAQEEDLKILAPQAVMERREAGLEGLVGNLDCVIINTEVDRLVPAVYELLRYTGLSCREAFFDDRGQSYVLAVAGSPSIVVRSRTAGANPFLPYNAGRLSVGAPATRLETFVFSTPDIHKYVRIQKSRGVRFLTDQPVESLHWSYIQTAPSAYTGNALGFIEWHGRGRSYAPDDATYIKSDVLKPDLPHLGTIFELDHAATRVRAQDRNAAILEFLLLTNYHYDFAVYVKSLNSITSVARRDKTDYAMVFTSGITPYTSDEASGPTEKFIRSYGTRVHHIAFRTEQIEKTVAALKNDGQDFLLELVGSPAEGLKQIFSEPSKNTLLVTEYIHRYGDFDGFFTQSNVEKLTAATGRQ